MNVYSFDPLQDSRWTELVGRHPTASIFHTSAWLDALWRTYRFTPIAFTTSRPAEPLWKGVVGMTVVGRSVQMQMRAAVEPTLLPVRDAAVSVSCHLYHPPAGYAAGGKALDDPRASSNEAQ